MLFCGRSLAFLFFSLRVLENEVRERKTLPQGFAPAKLSGYFSKGISRTKLTLWAGA